MLRFLHLCLCMLVVVSVCGQTVRGTVRDAETGEPIFSANVIVKGTTTGVTTDFEGEFKIDVASLPVTLQVSFIGYTLKEVNVADNKKRVDVKLSADQIMIDEAEVVGERISDKQKQAPLTVETMDAIAIKEAPSGNFYEGLGNLKGVDMTSASLGFKVINTRGFNSTSPVRSLQLIDGVDNQSPGLNFSLGNFLGASDLDVKSVDIVAGASSAYFGPGAFNGVINMETKSPFVFPGLSLSMKIGERQLFEQAVRYAEVVQNKEGQDLFAWKLNFYNMQANDWEAENYGPVDNSGVPEDNPGRFDAVNIYGDEYYPANDFSTSAPWNYPGLGTFYRTGYREIDLVDYNTKNLKANAAFHLRTHPEQSYDSPELIYAINVSTGTTVYQGDNRFSLRDIVFYQNRLEYRKKGKWFIRAYMTGEDAGNSYDPYATALTMLEQTRDPNEWAQVYVRFWQDSISPMTEDLGFPELELMFDDEGNPFFEFNYDSLDVWTNTYQDSLVHWHGLVEGWTNTSNSGIPGIPETGYLEPGSPEFNSLFTELTSSKNNELEGGTRLYDRSALYHFHGEYLFEPTFIDQIRVGANYRMYRPDSDGTILVDTAGTKITNDEWGAYMGVEQKFKEDKYILSGTIRFDKNQNFDLVISPAASLVIKPGETDYLRFSFSSALRNPTLANQYLFLDVGPAILSGNLNGVDSLITLESFSDYRNTLDTDTLRYFNIGPIKPEQVRTFEVGYRTSLGEKTYIDAGYYFSEYTDFIGFNIGIDAVFSDNGLPTDLQVFRYSANSQSKVRTQGFSIGINYYLNNNFVVAGNYSWNQLVTADEDDPIIPAFNTPEHKYNVSLSARDLDSKWGKKNKWGFGINYKWIQGFIFEGSPQFTGFVPTYDLVDAQVNYYVDKINCTFKVGASNVLDNQQIQTFGGPRVGRLGYFSILYELKTL
ncbi:TonB-dependent receptor [Sanyastnella coralliicola]|uniref:TonB-dependent receptor n=1 Tax=Sanyastnella coralliicola TaxID=3069118 RepID=UPI0027BA0B0A|nr:carboxypeptidase-like regulatory domain-containing protein [Longitalea sp. SCSIO 12813]